ncbi:hypothetical protein AAG570_011656 [Ranatra chinensis]|uniref:DUF4773 domain-containing protein n=1 Tax=Ranatra chinensis TaxID=642074 RepID=A0ABD0YYW2_9HEMI
MVANFPIMRGKMKNALRFGVLLAVVALSLGEYVHYDGETLDQEMIAELANEIKATRKDLSKLEEITETSDAAVRLGVKELTDKLKEMCKCESHKVCECCISKTLKIPIVGSYTLKGICGIFTVRPESKAVNFRVKLGPIKVMERDMSYSNMDEVCRKVEGVDNVEFCMKMLVSESQEKGLSSCLTIDAKIMDIFNKPFYLPCFNFKDQKLTMDVTMDDYKDDGVKVNLNALTMAKIFLLITTLVVLTTGKFIDSSESGEVDEDMIRSLGTEVEETRVELGEIQAISLGCGHVELRIYNPSGDAWYCSHHLIQRVDQASERTRFNPFEFHKGINRDLPLFIVIWSKGLRKGRRVRREVTLEGLELRLGLWMVWEWRRHPLRSSRKIRGQRQEGNFGRGASGKASIKDKLKNMCNCDTHKDCTCCAIKEMKIPVIGSYTLKVCSAVSVAPEDKTFNFKLHLGSIQLLNKDVSYVKTEEICKKIEKYQNLEFCMRMTVTESEEKGLSGCVVLQANIMDIFNKPIYLPCLHFNGKKLHMDEAMEEYKDDGVRLNLKTLWKKFKSLFSKKPSH